MAADVLLPFEDQPPATEREWLLAADEVLLHAIQGSRAAADSRCKPYLLVPVGPYWYEYMYMYMYVYVLV